MAPGPPRAIAKATPAILPFPTVPETAVANAWKWLTSPSSLSSFIVPLTSLDCFSFNSKSSYLPLTVLTAILKYLIFGKAKYTVKKKCAKNQKH